jgi:hypothetical protein
MATRVPETARYSTVLPTVPPTMTPTVLRTTPRFFHLSFHLSAHLSLHLGSGIPAVVSPRERIAPASSNDTSPPENRASCGRRSAASGGQRGD